MNWIMMTLWYALAFGAGWLLFGILRRTLLRAGHVRTNFTGREIPTSMGVGFAMLTVLEAPAAELLCGGSAPPVMAPLLIIVLGFALFGMLDDVVVTREPGGFKGHLSRLGAGGGVSTAIMKAFFGLALSLTVSFYYWRGHGPGMVAANSCVIALSANAVNLLDVRPGRAVKGFSFMFLYIFIGTVIGGLSGGWASFQPGTLLLFVPFFLWVVAYSKLDFSCRAMLGDTGSNILGAVIGVMAVNELSASNRWIFLAILVGFHLLCEVTSLSRIIDSVRLLKRIDTLGITTAESHTE